MAEINVKTLFRSVGINLNDRQMEAIQSLLCDCDHEGGGGEGIKKEILTRAEYTALENPDPDTLYIVLEAQSEIKTLDDNTLISADQTIDILQPVGGGNDYEQEF